MKEIVSLKIKQGRILNALSLQDLADLTGVSKQMISKYEKGDSMPSSKILILLAKSLKVNIDYFFTPSSIALGEVNFRKKSTFSVAKINALKEAIKIRLSTYIEIENILNVNHTNPLYKKKVESINDIEAIVYALRNDWEIGLDPIHNIIQLLEDKGIKIIEIDEPENYFDGLATVVNKQYPVIVVNKNFNVERKRFTLLHELGHLLLDVPVGNIKLEEKVCNRFASEFLFPSHWVIKEFGAKREGISLIELIEVQKKYGISIQAIMYRLLENDVISESRVSAFYRKLNSNPSLKSKVNQERFSTPEVSHRYEQLVYRALSQELISASKAASLLNSNINDILEKTTM